MQTLKLQLWHDTTLEVGGETRAIDLATGAHMLKPCSDKTAVSFREALCIHANAQVANFGIAQHWKWG
jgi:hypothetical protein